MEFLKAIIGEDLYKQVETKVNEHNANKDNKDKQIKVVNVSDGEYVSKQKYTSLETDLNNTKTSLATANTTIADLKKNNGDNTDLQKKIANYETEKNNLEAQHKEEKTKMLKEMAIKDALYNAKAKHPELLLSKFDLNRIALDEKGEKVVAGIEEQIKINKETYKDLFEESKDDIKNPYLYVPKNPSDKNKNQDAVDFVSIIKENQVKR